MLSAGALSAQATAGGQPPAAQVAAAAHTTGVAPSLTGAARWADSVRLVAERAQLAGDTLALAQAYRLAQRALTAFPDDALLLHYQGYIRYRQAQRVRDEDAARPVFEEAVALLERSAAKHPYAETYALLASATGSMIGSSMLRGVRYGMRASAAEDRAVELGADNPRVLLLRAVSAWYKPSAFGGGEEKARDLLQQAMRGFATDAPPPPQPAWGHAEAYAWLGQMEAQAGRRDAARAAYERALALAPGYAWVQYALLPALARR